MAVTAERLMVEVQADVRQALRELDRIDKRSTKSQGVVGRAGKAALGAFGGTAFLAGGVKAINLAKDFDQTIRQVAVATDQSGKGVEGLRKLALKMGKDTVFSAKDAGGAMLELAKGGLKSAQIEGGALEETLRLAAAGGLDLTNAATYMVQGLTTYGLKAKDANKVTTALAGGANASTASVESLGLALSQVGPGAVNAGWSINETVGALAAFDNAGIKGSDAGTSLKTMLQRLVPQTDKAAGAMKDYGLEFVNADGSIKGYLEVAEELRQGLGDLTEEERTRALTTIFGSDATRAASVMMRQGAKGAREMVKATKDQKKTQEMANSAMEGASGAWEDFSGSVETAAIQLGDKALPIVTKVLKRGAKVVDEVMTWGPEFKESFGWIVDGVKSLEGPLKTLGSLGKSAGEGWSGLPKPIKETVTQALLAYVAFKKLSDMGGGMKRSLSDSFGNLGPVQAYKGSLDRVTKAKEAQRVATANLAKAETNAAAARERAYRAQSAVFISADQRRAEQRAAQAQFGALATAQDRARVASDELAAAQRGRLTGALKATGRAVGGLAGPAGIMALSTAATTTNENLRTLGMIGGGALAGFSVGGPIGAGIGATAGLIGALAAKTRDAGGAADSTKASWQDYAGTLDQVSGAVTRATAAMAFQKLEQAGVLKSTSQLGLTNRDVVNATLGREGASKRVSAALSAEQSSIDALNRSVDRQRDAYKEALNAGGVASPAEEARLKRLRSEADARQAVVDKVRAETGAVSASVKNKQRELWATTNLGKALKGMPKGVRTKVEAMNVRPTMAQVKGLVADYQGMDRKQIKTLIQLSGGRGTKAQIDAVIASAKEAARQKPKVDVGERGGAKTRNMLADVLGVAKAVGRQAPRPTVSASDQATPVIRRVGTSLDGINGKTATTYIKTVATTIQNVIRNPFVKKADGGTVMGQRRPYGDKVLTALAPGEEVITNRNGEADAFRRDRAAGLIPAYAKGGTTGKKPGMSKAAKANRGLQSATVGDMAKAVTTGMKETTAYFRKLDQTLKKTLSGGREREMLKKSDRMEARLAKAWARSEGVTKRLDAAKAGYESAVQRRTDFTETARQGMASQATVLNAGNSANAIQGSLAAQVTKVKEYAGMLKQLRAKGYSEAVVSQVAEAGVEGGIDAARALLTSNSRDQVRQINESMATINSVAKATATDLGKDMYDGGIQAAAGLVRGLRAKKGAVNDAIREMTRDMIRTLKSDLKIKSPSKVADREVGRMIPAGVAGGILHGRKEVSRAASSLARAAIPTPAAPGSPAALMGGQRAGASVAFHFTTVNPQAEPESRTVNRSLQTVASLSLV